MPPDSSAQSLALKLAFYDDDRFFRLSQLFDMRQLNAKNAAKGSALLSISHGIDKLVAAPNTTHPLELESWLDSMMLEVHGQHRDQLLKSVTQDLKADSLRALVWLNTLLDIASDSLTDDWLVDIPASYQHDTSVLHTLILSAPSLESRGNALLRGQETEFAAAFQRLPLSVRTFVNGRIIEHSMRIAAARRDERFAAYTAAFARSTQLPSAGERVYQWQLMHYYELLGDTARFTKAADDYIHKYLVTGAGIQATPEKAWTALKLAMSLRKMDATNAGRAKANEWQKLALAAYPGLAALI